MNTPDIDLESIEALPADDARVLAYEARRAARVDRLESAADRAAAASAFDTPPCHPYLAQPCPIPPP